MTTRFVKAFIPIDITDARFVSSTIAEPDTAEPAWNSGTNYAEFAQVSIITTDSHLVYESLQSSNLNHPPTTSPTWWILKSNTNRFRLFEWNRGFGSQGVSPLEVVIRPAKRINAVMLEGLTAKTAAIKVQDGIDGPVVLFASRDLLARHATTPYQWCFAPFVYDKTFATFEIPAVIDPVITMTLTDPSGLCEIGRFAVGMAIDLGEVEWNSVSESENYSEIEWDAFGKATLNPIPSQPTLELPVTADAISINRVRQFKELANAKAVVWSAMQSIEAYREMHTLIGVYQRFKFTPLNHRILQIDLTLKGI